MTTLTMYQALSRLVQCTSWS